MAINRRLIIGEGSEEPLQIQSNTRVEGSTLTSTLTIASATGNMHMVGGYTVLGECTLNATSVLGFAELSTNVVVGATGADREMGRVCAGKTNVSTITHGTP